LGLKLAGTRVVSTHGGAEGWVWGEIWVPAVVMLSI